MASSKEERKIQRAFNTLGSKVTHACAICAALSSSCKRAASAGVVATCLPKLRVPWAILSAEGVDYGRYVWRTALGDQPKPECRSVTPSDVQVAGFVGGACRCVHTALHDCRHVPSCLRRGSGVAVNPNLHPRPPLFRFNGSPLCNGLQEARVHYWRLFLLCLPYSLTHCMVQLIEARKNGGWQLEIISKMMHTHLLSSLYTQFFCDHGH